MVWVSEALVGNRNRWQSVHDGSYVRRGRSRDPITRASNGVVLQYTMMQLHRFPSRYHIHRSVRAAVSAPY